MALNEAAIVLTRATAGATVDLKDDWKKDLGDGYEARVASFEDNLSSLEPIFVEHYAEVEAPRDSTPFRPNYEDWIRRQKAGNLIVLMLFHQDFPVGYVMYAVGPSKLHGKLVANEDIMFISKPHRRGMLGLRFLKHSYEVLKALNVHQVNVGSKMTHDISSLLRRLGFELNAQFFTKVL